MAVGPFAIFFNYGQATITPEAASILDYVGEACQSIGRCQIVVDGHVDRAEVHQQPASLSLWRAASVRTYLTARGVPNFAVTTVGLGATDLRVQTADNVREVQNRYAGIRVQEAGACSPAAALAAKKSVFPVQPPVPSSFLNIPSRLFKFGPARLKYGDINARLARALDQAGYPPRKYYQTCGGFAFVTSVERITQDGRPFAKDRFVPMTGPISTIEDFTIQGIVRALFHVQPGRFRIIVFLVKDQPTSFSDELVDPDTVKRWMIGGTNDVDPKIQAEPIPTTFYATALIYEFSVIGSKTNLVGPVGAQPAEDQLNKVKFFDYMR